MIPDTQLEEDQRRRLDQQVGSASDAEMAQMGGAPQPEWSPDWRNGAPDEPPAPVEAASDAETAQPPGPVPKSGPQSKPATVVELLAQVKAGQLSRPAIDTAFGPPPTPRNEPGAQTFAPKLGDSTGIDWKGLSDRLKQAHGEAGRRRGEQNFFANVGNTGKYVTDERLGSDDVAAAEDELKLGQAKQKMSDEQAAAEGRTAKAQTDAAELARRRDLDSWREMADRMKLTSAAQGAADKNKSEAEKAKTAAEAKAVEDQRKEQEFAEKTRLDQSLIDERNRKHVPGSGLGPKAKAAADKAAKATENVDTAADEIHDGRMTTMDLKGRDPEFRKAVTVAMNKKYPEDSLAKHQRFNEAYDEYATAKPGTAGGRLQASKTAMEHIGQMAEQFKKLGNGDSEAINSLKNRLAVQMGFGSAGDALKAFEAGTAVTAGETAGAYGANTEGGHENFAKIFSPNTKPSQAAAAMEMIREQMATRNRQADAALRQFAQSPGQHKLIDELGLVDKSSGKRTFRNKKTGKVITVSQAAHDKADDAADWEPQ